MLVVCCSPISFLSTIYSKHHFRTRYPLDTYYSHPPECTPLVSLISWLLSYLASMGHNWAWLSISRSSRSNDELQRHIKNAYSTISQAKFRVLIDYMQRRVKESIVRNGALDLTVYLSALSLYITATRCNA